RIESQLLVVARKLAEVNGTFGGHLPGHPSVGEALASENEQHLRDAEEYVASGTVQHAGRMLDILDKLADVFNRFEQLQPDADQRRAFDELMNWYDGLKSLIQHFGSSDPTIPGAVGLTPEVLMAVRRGTLREMITFLWAGFQSTMLYEMFDIVD